ncbi:lipoprotein [beta proteobacterium MWH-UniP1]
MATRPHHPIFQKKRRAYQTLIAAMLSSAILVGCGQKGPLTLPKPQFPAPPEEPASGGGGPGQTK